MLTTQARYFPAGVLAYTKPEALKRRCGISHFRIQAQLYAVGLDALWQ